MKLQNLMTASKLASRKQFLRRQPEVVNTQVMIKEINENIVKSYNKLEKSFNQISISNEMYLLRIYMKVLDKMLDEVIYAQERVNLIDCEKVKDQKCLKYVKGIVEYRDQCYQLKSKLKEVQQKLEMQEMLAQKTENQNKQLLLLCNKKDKQIQKAKTNMKNAIQKADKSEEMEIIVQKFQKQEIQGADMSNQLCEFVEKWRKHSLQVKKPRQKSSFYIKQHKSPPPKASYKSDFEKSTRQQLRTAAMTRFIRVRGNKQIILKTPQIVENTDKLGETISFFQAKQRKYRFNFSQLSKIKGSGFEFFKEKLQNSMQTKNEENKGYKTTNQIQ